MVDAVGAELGLQALDVGDVVLDAELEVALVKRDQVDFIVGLQQQDGRQQRIDAAGEHDRDFILDRLHEGLLGWR